MEGPAEFGIGMLIEAPDQVRLRPSGEIDLYTAPRLDDAVREQLADGRVGITLDLSKTSFIDSSGMGMLVRLAKLVSSAGGHLKVSSPTRSIARLFEISGVDRFLDVGDDGAGGS